MARNRFEGLTCFTCLRPAVGAEHAPPRGIFPKHLRNGIISVPACQKHNTEKTQEDEYFRNAVASTLEKNKEGLPVVDSMVRSIEYNPHLVKTFLPGFRPVVAGGVQTAVFSVNIRRFNRSAQFVVRALWFHEFAERLHEEIDIHWRNFWNRDGSRNPLFDFLVRTEHRWPGDYKGAQPKIFQYDFHRAVHRRRWFWICRMKFFEGPPVCAVWTGRLPKPKDWREGGSVNP